MALEFPANPADGDVYPAAPNSEYIYNDAKGAWLSLPTEAAKTITSDIAPVNPKDGDQWFNSIDGTLYIYYTDANTSQWVESRAPIVANGYYSPNYVINGGFDIWQRGTTQSVSGYGSADRWSNVISGTAPISQETTDLPSVAGIRYGIKFVTGASSSFGQFFTALEAANVAPLRGKTVTLSAYVKVAGSYAGNWQMKMFSSNSVDSPLSSITAQIGSTQNIATSATTSWTRVSYTVTVPSDAVGLKIEFSPDTVQPSGVTLRMTGVQLEEGSAATTFRRNANSIQGELAACQRYYVSSYSIGTTAGSLTWVGALQSSGVYEVVTTSYLMCPLSFPVQMRTSPTLVAYSPATGAINKVVRDRIGVSSSDADIVFTDVSSRAGISFSSSGQSACRIVYHYTANAEL